MQPKLYIIHWGLFRAHLSVAVIYTSIRCLLLTLKARTGTDLPTNPRRWAWVEMPEKGTDHTSEFIALGAKYRYLSTVEDVERFSLCFCNCCSRSQSLRLSTLKLFSAKSNCLLYTHCP